MDNQRGEWWGECGRCGSALQISAASASNQSAISAISPQLLWSDLFHWSDPLFWSAPKRNCRSLQGLAKRKSRQQGWEGERWMGREVVHERGRMRLMERERRTQRLNYRSSAAQETAALNCSWRFNSWAPFQSWVLIVFFESMQKNANSILFHPLAELNWGRQASPFNGILLWWNTGLISLMNISSCAQTCCNNLYRAHCMHNYPKKKP